MITAEEFFNKYGGYTREEMLERALEFTKLHVKEALKLVMEKAKMDDIDRPEDYNEEDGNGISKILNKNIFACESYYYITLNKESVYTAYPLENIK